MTWSIHDFALSLPKVTFGDLTLAKHGQISLIDRGRHRNQLRVNKKLAPVFYWEHNGNTILSRQDSSSDISNAMVSKVK